MIYIYIYTVLGTELESRVHDINVYINCSGNEQNLNLEFMIYMCMYILTVPGTKL